MNSFEKVVSIFEAITKETSNNDVAAAILTFTAILYECSEELDHRICLGIRHGLFGSKTPNDTSISLDIENIFNGLCEIADRTK
jgi:hypothetical protein